MYRQFLAILFLLLFSTGLAADPVTWTLNNANFTNQGAAPDWPACPDGSCGEATGWFTWDPDTQSVIDWAFNVTGGSDISVLWPDAFPDSTYTPGNSSLTQQFASLIFTADVPPAGTDYGFPLIFRLVNIAGDFAALDTPVASLGLDEVSECYSCAPGRWTDRRVAYLSAEQPKGVPEPATFALFALGIAGLILLRRV